MKCNICENEFGGDGFPPLPFGGLNGEKCCRNCFEGQVAEARKLYSKCKLQEYPEIDDEIIIFYLEDSSFPGRQGINWKDYKLKRGYVTDINEGAMIFYGTWGNFGICPSLGDIIGKIE